ncbi:MAG: diguanylate cyclase [Magnetococcales bacterium]|nr:diguanylate cyclase [Magnetococcales bacterium]
MPQDEIQPVILIVDRSQENIDTLTDMLQESGIVRHASQAEQALQEAYESVPDLILLAMDQASEEGFEICRRLKAEDITRDAPIIMMGKGIHAVDAEMGLEAGAVDFISQPIIAPILRARVAHHIAMHHQRDVLESLAIIDPITDLPNRRHFEQTLEMEWRRAARAKDHLSLLLIDVDPFNDIANRFGYDAAEELLQQVARAMADTLLRATDLISYLQDATFVALLPEVDPDGANDTAERLRAQAAAISNDPENHPISISIGCATTTPQPGSSPEELMDAADNMLNTAIDEGRDRVKSILCGNTVVYAAAQPA